jgi:hypothetical protein
MRPGLLALARSPSYALAAPLRSPGLIQQPERRHHLRSSWSRPTQNRALGRGSIGRGSRRPNVLVGLVLAELRCTTRAPTPDLTPSTPESGPAALTPSDLQWTPISVSTKRLARIAVTSVLSASGPILVSHRPAPPDGGHRAAPSRVLPDRLGAVQGRAEREREPERSGGSQRPLTGPGSAAPTLERGTRQEGAVPLLAWPCRPARAPFALDLALDLSRAGGADVAGRQSLTPAGSVALTSPSVAGLYPASL